jgi:hypothetical protein
MAEAAENVEVEDPALALERATDEAVEACGGDAWSAVRALLVANSLLEAQIDELTAKVSAGYNRGRARKTK